MPIDPSIPLQLRPVQLPAYDPGTQALTLAQLAGALQQRQAGELALQQAQEERQARQQLKDLYAKTGGFPSDSEQQRQFLGQVGAVDPKAALQIGESFRKGRLEESQIRKEQALTTKAQADTATSMATMQTKFFDLQRQKLDLIHQTLSGATPETWAQQRDFLVTGLGVPPDQIPLQYDATTVAAAGQRALTQKERLDVLDKQAQRQLQERTANRQAAQISYGLGNDLDAAVYQRYGAELGPQGRPTPAMIEQARQDVEQQRVRVSGAQGVEAARVATSVKPLEGATATNVAEFDSLLALTADARTLLKDEFVGPIRGRAAGVIEKTTGGLSSEEIVLRRTVADMADMLARARSGAAIPPGEYTRLLGMLPQTTDQPNVFRAKLNSFERAIQQFREATLNVATSGRGALPRAAPTPLPGGSPPATPPPIPSGKVKTQAEVDAAVANPQNKRADGSLIYTKEQIIRELRKQGYEVR